MWRALGKSIDGCSVHTAHGLADQSPRRREPQRDDVSYLKHSCKGQDQRCASQATANLMPRGDKAVVNWKIAPMWRALGKSIDGCSVHTAHGLADQSPRRSLGRHLGVVKVTSRLCDCFEENQAYQEWPKMALG
jgi:hypothetical protein